MVNLLTLPLCALIVVLFFERHTKALLALGDKYVERKYPAPVKNQFQDIPAMPEDIFTELTSHRTPWARNDELKWAHEKFEELGSWELVRNAMSS